MFAGADHDPDALSPEEFLDHLRAASRRLLRSGVMRDLRSSCDMWTIDPKPVDPIEPLTNRGRRTIKWPSDTWGSISADLLAATHRAAQNQALSLPAALAEYSAFVHLELAAREEPPLGVRPDAFMLPLSVAARERASSTEFRRYVLGWHARAGTLPWNDPGMAFAASLAVSLGSSHDAVIGERVRALRELLDQDARTARERYRDLVRPDERELWCQVVAASAPDAKAWAEGFMR